jgi:hypothetical protein
MKRALGIVASAFVVGALTFLGGAATADDGGSNPDMTYDSTCDMMYDMPCDMLYD